jgi:isochorismate pyruvate lyase
MTSRGVEVKVGTSRLAAAAALRRRGTMSVIEPDACATMTEVRAGVDAVDRELIELLARRFAYIRAAARIKRERGQVRDEPRKAQVIANARGYAEQRGVPVEAIAALWEQLVEASIEHEEASFDAR